MAGGLVGFWLMCLCQAWGASFEDGPFFADEAEASESAFLAPKLPKSGLTVSGASGLVTMPIPAPTDGKKYRFAVKSAAEAHAEFALGTQTYRTDLREEMLQVAITVVPGAEISVSRASSRRRTSPAHIALDGGDELYNFGIQISDDPDSPFWTLGAQYAPATDEQLARLDVDQIAQMRSLYSTIGGAVSRRGSMFVHLRNCFMPEQTWVSPSGQVVRQGGRNLVMIGLGAGWKLGHRHSLFAEVTRLDYQGLLNGGNRRWEANAGARFSTRSVTLECLGRSLETDPTLIAGVTAGY